MTSMRESPIRRQSQARPPWLLAVLIGVGALVVVGVGFAIFSLVRGGSSDASTDTGGTSPSPCVTAMVSPAEILPDAALIKVNVYNATGTAGLAGKTAKELGSRDFKVVKVANDPLNKKIAGIAQIRFGTKGESAAQVLLFHQPGAELMNDGRKGKTIDFAMGDAFTALAPVDEVAAAMAVPTPSVSGEGCSSADATPSE